MEDVVKRRILEGFSRYFKHVEEEETVDYLLIHCCWVLSL